MSIAVLGVDPDSSSVILDDFLAQRQSDTGALVIVARMQPLEDDEHLLGVLAVDPDAVVGDSEVPTRTVRLVLDLFALDPDHRGAIGMPELDGVADQVLPQHRQQSGVTGELGEVVGAFDLRL